MTGGVRWSAGSDHGLVWPGGLGILDGAIEAGIAEQMFSLLYDGADLPGFLEGLGAACGAGLLGLPGFAVALMSERHVHLAVRGDFAARIAGTEAVLLEGAGITTWVERLLPRGSAVTLGRTSYDGGQGHLLLAGIGPAIGLSWRQGGPTDRGIPAEREEVATGPSVPTRPAPVRVAPVDPAAAEPLVAVDPLATAESQATAEPLAAAGPLDAAGPGGTPEQAAGMAWESLWEATIARGVEAAAIRESATPPGVGSRSGAGAVAEWSAEWSRSHAAATPGPTGDSPDPAGGEGASDIYGDHDGETLARLDLVMERRELDERTAHEVWDGLILTALCPNDHPNPPGRELCAVCGAVVGQRTASIPQPTLGRLRASSGQVLDLDTSIVVGRNPRGPRFLGAQVPKLLPLPFEHISGSHLEVRVEGWRIVALDLGSTNGTVLKRRGEPDVPLTREPHELRSSDILDLGDGVTLVIELATSALTLEVEPSHE